MNAPPEFITVTSFDRGTENFYIAGIFSLDEDARAFGATLSTEMMEPVYERVPMATIISALAADRLLAMAKPIDAILSRIDTLERGEPNTITLRWTDASGNTGHGSRSSADAARDVHIMDVAVEFFYARQRGVNITPEVLFRHVMREDVPAGPAPTPSDPAVEVIDLDRAMWDSIKQAASESPWIPHDYYYVNDWVADICRFLRDPAGPQPGDLRAGSPT